MIANLVISFDNTVQIYALEVIRSQSINRQLRIRSTKITVIHSFSKITNYDHIPSIVNTSRLVKCLYSDSLATLRRSLRVLIVCNRLEKTQYTIPVSHSARGITAIRSEFVCSTSCDV